MTEDSKTDPMDILQVRDRIEQVARSWGIWSKVKKRDIQFLSDCGYVLNVRIKPNMVDIKEENPRTFVIDSDTFQDIVEEWCDKNIEGFDRQRYSFTVNKDGTVDVETDI